MRPASSTKGDPTGASMFVFHQLGKQRDPRDGCGNCPNGGRLRISSAVDSVKRGNFVEDLLLYLGCSW